MPHMVDPASIEPLRELVARATAWHVSGLMQVIGTHGWWAGTHA